MPGKKTAYLDLLKNYTKKIYEYNFKQGRAFGYYISSMIMPAGSSAEYDITVITVTTDLKLLLDDSLGPKAILKKSNPEYSDAFLQSILDQYGQVRTLVKRDIFTVLAEIDPAAPPTKYYSVDYMKTAAGKAADYAKMEKDTWMPIHNERIMMGVLTDWILLEKTLPYSSTDAYDYETVNFFNDLSFLEDSKYTEAMKNLFQLWMQQKAWQPPMQAEPLLKTRSGRLNFMWMLPIPKNRQCIIKKPSLPCWLLFLYFNYQYLIKV